jgi:hypothetical protein
MLWETRKRSNTRVAARILDTIILLPIGAISPHVSVTKMFWNLKHLRNKLEIPGKCF